MPRWFLLYTGPAATRPEPRSLSSFPAFRKAVFWFERNRVAINSNLRRTYNTRTRCRPACTSATPASANTPGNTVRRRPALHFLPALRPRSSLPSEPQPLPALPLGTSPAFRHLSRLSGYSTTPYPRESAPPPPHTFAITCVCVALAFMPASSMQLYSSWQTIWVSYVSCDSRAICSPFFSSVLGLEELFRQTRTSAAKHMENILRESCVTDRWLLDAVGVELLFFLVSQWWEPAWDDAVIRIVEDTRSSRRLVIPGERHLGSSLQGEMETSNGWLGRCLSFRCVRDLHVGERLNCS